MLERGLSDEEWKPVEDFYIDLQRLGREHSFETLVVIMPIHALVCLPAGEDQPYPSQARQRLEALGMVYVDSFSLWTQQNCGMDRFLPEGPDGHLSSDGYSLIADAIAARLLANSGTAHKLSAYAEAAH
jgi:hypothetical protein